METSLSSASEPISSNIGRQSTDVFFEDERSKDDGVSSKTSHLWEGGPGDLDTPSCINIMFICGEWGSKSGGLSTFNRELAVNLAKISNDKIKVHCYVSESSEAERLDASGKGVALITARRSPGSSDPLDWLKTPPSDLSNPDVVVAHGRKFGGAAYFIRRITNCRWIQFVHVYCEALGKYKLESGVTTDAIADNEEKNRRELELCEASDLVVAVGSLLQGKYQRSLRDIKVEVITPGIFEQYVNPAARQSEKFESSQEEFCIFMFGRGSFEDFQLKGYDVIGKAVALLERKFELTFVGAAQDEQRRVEKWFLEETKISRQQLTIRGFCSYEEMKRMLQEADLVVLPSRTEGFGLVALETISAAVPVLVSSESGVAKALQDVEGGMSTIVKSYAPEEWANRIRQLSEQKPGSRHTTALQLREQYNLKYSWQGECKKFEKMILHLVERTQIDVPLSCHLTGNTTTEDVPKAVFTMDGKEVPKSEYLSRLINADPILSEKPAEPKKRSKKELQAVIDSGCSPKPAAHTSGRVQGVQIEALGTLNKTGEQTLKGSKEGRKISVSVKLVDCDKATKGRNCQREFGTVSKQSETINDSDDGIVDTQRYQLEDFNIRSAVVSPTDLGCTYPTSSATSDYFTTSNLPPSTVINSREKSFGGGIMEIASYSSKRDGELHEKRFCGSNPDSRGRCTEEGATISEKPKLFRFMSWPSDPPLEDTDLSEHDQAVMSYKRSNSHEPKSKSKDKKKSPWKRVANFFSTKRYKRSWDPFNSEGNSGESSLDRSMVISSTGSDSQNEPDQSSIENLSLFKEKDAQRLSISGSVCSGESLASPTAAWKRHRRSYEPSNCEGNSGESSLNKSVVISSTGSDCHDEPDQNSPENLSPFKGKDAQRLSISGCVCSGESVASPTAASKGHRRSYEPSNFEGNSGESSLDKSMVISSTGSDSHDESKQSSTENMSPFKENDTQRLTISGSVSSGESVASPKAAGYQSRYRLLPGALTSSGKTISIIHCSHMEERAFEDEVFKLFYHFSENLAYKCHLDKLEMVKVAENKLRWAMQSVQRSDFLFICVSPELKRIFDLPPEEISTSLEDDQACMVRLESDLILVDLAMKASNKNGKYMPILLKGSSKNDVPCFLNLYPKYCWPNEERRMMCIIEGKPESVPERPSH